MMVATHMLLLLLLLLLLPLLLLLSPQVALGRPGLCGGLSRAPGCGRRPSHTTAVLHHWHLAAQV